MRQVILGARMARLLGIGLLILILPLFVRAAGPVKVSPAASPSQGGEQAPGEVGAADQPSFPNADNTPMPTQLHPSETAGVAEAARGFDFAQTDDPAEADGAPWITGTDGVVIFTDTAFATGGEPDTAGESDIASESETIGGSDTIGVAEASPAPMDGVWSYENDRISVNITKKQQEGFTYYAAEIILTDPSQFSYAFSHERYGASEEALSDIALRHDPLVAINGDYYSFHSNGVIIRGGEVFRKNKSSRHLLIVDQNGDLRVMTDRSEKQGVVASRLIDEGVLHTFEFGPVLVENGQAVKLNSAILRVGDGYLEPRTAIGQLGPLHYLILVVDGRSQSSAGCDLPTLQQLFVDHGVRVAFNLDGGGSTTLWFDGRVINNPASGDERKVSDIVMFMR